MKSGNLVEIPIDIQEAIGQDRLIGVISGDPGIGDIPIVVMYGSREAGADGNN
jgi:hypothetical protein